MKWPAPWRLVDDRMRKYIGGELRWELDHVPDHPLTSRSFQVVAMMDVYDTAIIQLDDGSFGYVELTWGPTSPHFEPIADEAELARFLPTKQIPAEELRKRMASDVRIMGVPSVIAVLEDDAGRTDAMKGALAGILPTPEVMFFDNAPDMIAWLSGNLSSVRLLCLDHDLGPNRKRDGELFDPGIGRDVVDFLITRAPVCPVIIHSSNSIGAGGMVTALEGAGWSAERVVPYDDLTWVRERWHGRVTSHL